MQVLANELNTTVATISRALNDSPEIGEEMKTKIKTLAKKYNFRPNSYASTLRRGRAKTIAVVVPYINRHFFSNIIHNIEKIANKSGYNIMILQTEENFAKEKENISLIIDQKVSGIIISVCKGAKNSKHLKKAIDEGIKVVQIDNILSDIDTSYIKNEDREGAYNSTMHLLQQGYKNIALFTGNMLSQIYQDRKQGYIDAHIEMGIPHNKNLILENANTRDGGKEAMLKILNNGEKIDAIFSAGDYPALGAYLICKEKGIKIPEEIGIVGFANEHFAELVSPSMTSSDQHSAKIGQLAAEQILKEIDNTETELLKTSLLPELIIRESTKKSEI